MQRVTIVETEPDAFERSIDMIRKLRHRGDVNGYTATALLLVDWDSLSDMPTVAAKPELVPEDVRPGQFFTAMIDQLLSVTPITYHVKVRERRERRERRNIPVAENNDTS